MVCNKTECFWLYSGRHVRCGSQMVSLKVSAKLLMVPRSQVYKRIGLLLRAKTLVVQVFMHFLLFFFFFFFFSKFFTHRYYYSLDLELPPLLVSILDQSFKIPFLHSIFNCPPWILTPNSILPFLSQMWTGLYMCIRSHISASCFLLKSDTFI